MGALAVEVTTSGSGRERLSRRRRHVGASSPISFRIPSFYNAGNELTAEARADRASRLAKEFGLGGWPP